LSEGSSARVVVVELIGRPYGKPLRSSMIEEFTEMSVDPEGISGL